MKDSHLLMASLIAGIIGLIALYLISSNSELPLSQINEAKNMEEFSDVRIKGEVLDIRKTDKVTKIVISSQEEIGIVVFDKVNLTKGNIVVVDGVVSEYKGNKEILAKKITNKG